MSLFGKFPLLLPATLVEMAAPSTYVTRLIPLQPTNPVGAVETSALEQPPGSPSSVAC
jgi:hypothetical protein